MLSLQNRNTVNSFRSLNQRYFTTLDGSSDYFTIPTVTLTGDFVIEADISTTSSLTQYIIGNNTDDNGYIRVDATTGVIAVNFNSTKTIVGTIDVSDGKLYNVKVINVSGTATLYIDGVSDGSVAGLSGNNVFDRIGDNHTSSTSFNGVIANVKITDNGTLIRDYPIDEDFSTTDILVNRATTLGSDLFIDGTFSNPTNFPLLPNTSWSVTGGQLQSDGTNVLTTIIKDFDFNLLPSGTTTLLEADIITATSNNFRIYSPFEGVYFDTIVESGDKFKLIITSDGSYAYLTVRNSTAQPLYLDNLSIKQADGYGTAIGSPSSEQFTLVGSDWLGAELVVGGNFDNSADYPLLPSNGWSVTSGQLQSDGTNTGGTPIQDIQWDDLPSGSTFLFNIDVITATSNNFRVFSPVVGYIDQTVESGDSVSLILTSDGAYDWITLRNSTAQPLYLDNMSIKRILQAP